MEHTFLRPNLLFIFVTAHPGLSILDTIRGKTRTKDEILSCHSAICKPAGSMAILFYESVPKT